MAGTVENVLAPWANTSWGRSFLHPEDAYKKSGAEAEQGWQQAQNFQQPYNQAGTDQIARLTGAQDKLMNPAALQNEWASGYEMSPYAKQSLDQSRNAGLDAASSQGLLGSSAALNNIQSGASNIMNADRQQYMNDLMEKYKAGIGIGTNTYNTGAQVGSQLGNQSMQAGENRGWATYGANTAPGEQFKNLLNMGMKAAMAKFGPASGGH